MHADQIPHQPGPGGRSAAPLMSAVELALATRTDVPLIERLEQHGVLPRLPGAEPVGRGVRRFDACDREWVGLVRGLLATGMPFADLVAATAQARETGSVEVLLERVERHRAAVMDELARTVRSVSAVERTLAHLREAVGVEAVPRSER